MPISIRETKPILVKAGSSRFTIVLSSKLWNYVYVKDKEIIEKILGYANINDIPREVLYEWYLISLFD